MNSRSLLSRSLVFHGNRPPHLGNERVLHALRRLTGADVNENLDIERRGRRWVLNPSDFVQGDVFRTGYKDYWDVWHLERLLPANAAIADVGANFGYYAIELCLALGPLARAVAFEPFPASFARLGRHHLRRNGLEERARPLQLGLSDASGKAAMAVRGGRSNSGSGQVGTEGTGQHRPLLLVEIDPPRLQEGGSSADALIDMLRSLGYRLFQAQRRALVPVGEAGPRALVNVFCMHEGSCRQLA